ncbi:MAG: histidinol-phosphate transaminase [Eggerthellaceae bacterium]|nr:histidinol-phosphate transaminase [Eggerthellaceae bacterium]
MQGLVPYDPKYLPAEALLSANENPLDVSDGIRREIEDELREVPFNRYPDPLANELRDMIAHANGLKREQVLLGNGGDELLFNIALAWGGPGRTCLDMPPTFSVYAANARLTGTRVVNVPLRDDFSIDEEAVLARVAQGDIDYLTVTSPNNPTGKLARVEFIERLLDATDALVMVDEAYYEFSRSTVLPLLAEHKNLIILRTFSKAYSLAGVRLGYVLAHEDVINEFVKVRQPYSVDALSQIVARAVYAHRHEFEEGALRIAQERERVFAELSRMEGVRAYSSDANYLLFRMLDDSGVPSCERAAQLWERLYERGVLVRDFSRSALLEGCLRVSIGTHEENNAFLSGLRNFMEGQGA